MSDLVEPSTTEAAMRKAAMSLPPSDFGSHRAIQAAARAADDLIAPYRARIEALEGDADMVDEREMRSNLRIEALEAALGRLLAHVGFGNASQHEPNCKCVIHEACAVLTALAKGDEDA